MATAAKAEREKAIVRAENVIGVLLSSGRGHERRHAVCQRNIAGGSSLPIRVSSVISPHLIARLIKGCRGDPLRVLSVLEKP
jgi:hypothetical protein